MNKNIYWHHSTINRVDRENRNQHKSLCLWLTGLSGSGKSTTACQLEQELFAQKINTYLLDGDNVRHGLNRDLGFSENDRNENIRRIGETAKLFVDAGIIVITSFISPYRSDRDKVRELFNKGDFIEVYVSCNLDVCENRDPKGLYKKARRGEIPNFTGISAPYEEPSAPEIVIKTDSYSIAENVTTIIDYLKTNGYV